ncbi:MAG: PhzF family phenazine biosynthesis protein [Candidatus Lokiarchaeota archaeon]|nr:PhzF family phenazine biosynthesis protein [Candidatus Lokiarchaeota archaeon]
MKKFKFKKIDAFASTKSEGNPAGCIYLESGEDITSYEMKLIAKELKGFVNEVGYIKRIGNYEFNLKYYSSEREVDFCGHATIAIMYDLIKNDKTLIDSSFLTVMTKRGNLTVENKILNEDSVFITSPIPQETVIVPTILDIISALNVREEEIETILPIKIINAGLTTLIVPIKSLEILIKIMPNFNVLKNFCLSSEIDIIEVFTNDVSNSNNNFRVRVFAPTFGYLEDPATGSGNSAFGYYLIQNELWNDDTIKIEQNRLRDEYNLVKLRKKQDDSGIERVLFGGGAITRIEGEYMIYPQEK